MTSTTTDVIDGISSSTAIKAPVRVATTANITLSGTQIIDGVSIVANDRVLVKDQTDTTENGIYNASSSVWSRAADFDGNRDVRTGTLIKINSGTTNSKSVWRCTTTDPVVIGTSNITFELSGVFAQATTISQGTIELATDAEAITGTDTARATTPANVRAAAATNIAAAVSAATEKTTPVDADLFAILDSAASNVLKKLTWSNIKATLATTLQFLQSGTGAVSRSVQSKLQDTISVKDFGAVGDGVTDDTSAINAAFAVLRAAYLPDSLSGRNPVTLLFPQGTYLCSGSINATAIRGYGWNVDFRGAEIISTATGLVSFDLLHSRYGTINNMVIRSESATKPKMGVQVGYIDHNTSSGNITFNDCNIVGYFSQACYYNGGSEQTVENNCTFRNEDSASTSYAAIYDSANWWKRTSSFQTGDLVTVSITNITQANPAVVTAPGHAFGNGDQIRIDNVSGMTNVNGNYYTVAGVSGNTFQLSGIDSTGFSAYTSGGDVARVESYSFCLATHNNTTYFKTNGGKAIWQGWHSDDHMYNNCYCAVGSGETAIDLIFDVTNGGVYHQNLHIGMRVETTGMSTCVRFNRLTDGTIHISGFKYWDSLPFATDQIFSSTSNSGSVVIHGMDIRIPRFQANSGAGPTNGLFNDPAKFTGSNGTIVTRLSSVTGLPTNFVGDLTLQSGPRYFGRPRVFGSINTQTSHTGDTNETVLGTITVPGNAMGPNGFVEVDAHFSFTGTNTKTARIRFNGLSGTTYHNLAPTTQLSAHANVVIYNRNSASSQVSTGAGTAFGASSLGAVTSSVDTTSDVNIVFTGQLTNTGETIAIEAASVKVTYRA